MRIVLIRLMIAGICGVSLAGCGQSSSRSGEAAQAARFLDQLQPEDRDLALVQWACPVCGNPLGSEAGPVKKEFDGRVVFFRTQDCADAYAQDSRRFESKDSE